MLLQSAQPKTCSIDRNSQAASRGAYGAELHSPDEGAIGIEHSVSTSLVQGDVDFRLWFEAWCRRKGAIVAKVDAVLGLFARPNHSFASHETRRFSACPEQRLVALSEPPALCPQIETLKCGVGAPFDAASSLVAAGVGRAILTSLDVIAEVGSGDMVFILRRDKAAHALMLAPCGDPARPLSAAVQMMVGEASATFPQPGFRH